MLEYIHRHLFSKQVNRVSYQSQLAMVPVKIRRSLLGRWSNTSIVKSGVFRKRGNTMMFILLCFVVCHYVLMQNFIQSAVNVGTLSEQFNVNLYHLNFLHYILHYKYIMSAIVSQITSLTIVNSTVYSGTDQRQPQSYASLGFVWGIHKWLVKSPHKGPVTRNMFPFDDVIMALLDAFCVHNMFLWIVIIRIGEHIVHTLRTAETYMRQKFGPSFVLVTAIA